MSGQGDGVPKLHPRVREAVRKAGNKGDPPVVERAPSAGGQKLFWLPYLMLVFVIATSLRVAIEAFGAGQVEAAIGPLLAILFAAFFVWRRLRRKH
jgi:CelD/BcsL family acetyltransferase involved in cellulose biosynthesis